MSHSGNGYRLAWATALAVAALCASSCSGRHGRQEKPARSVLWVTRGGTLEFADLAGLEQRGVGELLVEAGRLSWQGATPRIEPVATLTMPRRTGVTLVVTGTWPQDELDAAEAAESLAAELEKVAGPGRQANLEALGFHFDVGARRSLASYGATLEALRAKLDPPAFVSATVERSWLAEPGLPELARSVDFVVPFLYGQRPGEPEDAAAWDLRRVEANLRRMEELGGKYLMGVVTLARAVEIGGRGAETTRFSLPALVRNPALELAMGFSLEGIDRSLYQFKAREATSIGPLQLKRGAGLRVMGLASHHLEELQRHLGALDLERMLGTAYYRLAAPEEEMSLSLANLDRALAPEPAEAEPRLRLLAAGNRRYTVEVENASDERSDVMLLAGNYVELRVTGGTFGRAEPGDFHRWELLEERDGELVRSFRRATVLRFYAPILDGGETLRSGVIEVSGGTVSGSGAFVVPGGRTVAVVFEAAAVEPPPAK